MGGLFLMEEKKTWEVGAGSGIGWLKALLVSYLISVLLLLLLSFLLWKFSWKEKLGAGGLWCPIWHQAFPAEEWQETWRENGGFSGASALESCILPF